MPQRHSDYERKERDFYATPKWCTDAIIPYIPPTIHRVWEPACGAGDMVMPLIEAGYNVTPSDIEPQLVGAYIKNFLTDSPCQSKFNFQAIITNPPYGRMAPLFVERALNYFTDNPAAHWFVAMLLPNNFDTASARSHLFGNNQYYSGKLVLTRRIVWFERDGAAPSSNHAWFMWTNPNDAGPINRYYYEISRR